jgi:hypothetical protein
MGVNVKLRSPAQQMECVDQSGNPEIMVPVQMADEYTADPLKFDFISSELKLCSFGAVD